MGSFKSFLWIALIYNPHYFYLLLFLFSSSCLILLLIVGTHWYSLLSFGCKDLFFDNFQFNCMSLFCFVRFYLSLNFSSVELLGFGGCVGFVSVVVFFSSQYAWCVFLLQVLDSYYIVVCFSLICGLLVLLFRLFLYNFLWWVLFCGIRYVCYFHLI